MSSSPSSIKQRSPKRTSPKRAPLQEQTASRANEALLTESQPQEKLDIYNANPFPTKPSQVLLPSTIRKQKSYGLSPLGDTFGFLSDSDTGKSSEVSRSSRGSRPTVRLKRSVKALRDLYESQGDDSSRPSTATSPPLRPSTANSLRLRSLSSSESLSGAYAWESLQRVSDDDLALLPTLPSGSSRAVKRLASRNSFTSIVENPFVTSSPNYKVLGATSSPRPAAFKDLPLLEAFEDPPSSRSGQQSSSSPNVVRLAHTSSTDQFQSSDQSSSPNVVRLAHTSSTDQFGSSDPVSSPNVIKLGTSSPDRSPATVRRHTPEDYSLPSRSSSGSSRKRKRSDTGGGRSFAERIGARNPLASSPPTNPYVPSSTAPNTSSPIDAELPSSAPQSIQQSSVIDESSPVIRLLGQDDFAADSSSIAETHSSLQAALSSSPPRIQYPVVRAPPPSQHIGISVPKRNSRSLSTEGTAPRFSLALSEVPSEGSFTRSRRASGISNISLGQGDLDDYLNSDDLAPASNYILNEAANQTQIRLVPDQEPETATQSQCDCEYNCDHRSVDPHHNEATDEVSALPLSEYAYRSPPLRPVRSGSNMRRSSSDTNSVHLYLNSMKSFTQSRHNSFLRPSSSSSSIHSIAPVPSWARRYYSGMYQDTFQYLYSSNSYLSLRELSARQAPIPLSTLTPTPSRPETIKSNGNNSFRNVHQAMSDRLGSLLHPKRPKLAARKSHTLPGTGPLVSNPVGKLRSPPATAAHPFAHGARRQSYQHPQTQSLPMGQHNRAVSMPLPPVDPRAHWAGVVEIHEMPHEDGRGSSYTVRHHSYAYSVNGSQSDSQNQSVIHHHPSGSDLRRSWHRWSSSPHLHHDARLNTGSSVSRGFGFPFNSKSRWSTGIPEITTNDGSKPRSKFIFDRRSMQVLAFSTGFIMPLTWIVAAFLPLPKRPSSFSDIEKQVFRESQLQGRQSQTQRQSYPPQQSRTQSMRYSQAQDPELESGSLEVLAKLRLERHHAGVAELQYQNARWWRNLNRWMSCVGVVVCVLVVVLAILGSKGNWGGN